MFKLDLEKTKEPEIKLSTSSGFSKKQESSRKTSTSAFRQCQSLWLCGSQQTVENSSRDWNTRSPYLPPEKSVCSQETTVITGHGTTDGSKLGKEYVKAVYCHSVYLTSMQSTSCEMPDWMTHNLESRLPGEIPTISDCRWYHSNGRKWRETKEPLDEGEKGEWKGWFETQ